MKTFLNTLFLTGFIHLLILTSCGQSNDRPSSIQIADDNEPGDRLELTGIVVDENGMPIQGVKLFFYQANQQGEYESTLLGMPSYARLRGTVYTDEQGEFKLKTIIPGNYPGESDGKHIHVIAKARGYNDWKFEFLFEGWVSESLRKEIKINGDAIVVNPQLLGDSVWQDTVKIIIVR